MLKLLQFNLGLLLLHFLLYAYELFLQSLHQIQKKLILYFPINTNQSYKQSYQSFSREIPKRSRIHHRQQNQYQFYRSTLYLLIQMRTRQSTEQRFLKNYQTRVQTRAYQTIKARIQAGKDQKESRKHNSPDLNRYKPNEARSIPRRNKSPKEEKDITNSNNHQRDGQFHESVPNGKAKGRQLSKTSSNPLLLEKQRQEQDNQQYQKLQDKLTLIETKLAQMKEHVERKRQQKRQMVEARLKRQQQRQDQRKASQNRAVSKNASLKQFITQVPEHRQLHTFQNNPYSPRHDIYYISQIIKSYKDDKSLGRQHLLTSLHILKILENSTFATDEEMRKRRVTLPRRPGVEGRKSVIFDLDETLIHCNDTLTPPYDVKLPITFPTGEVIEAGINIRPYAFEILKNLSKNFEIIVFTASHSCYANVVLDHLDPKNEYIHHRLFREHCYQTPQGMYCKDLRVMDRDLESIVLVDNAAYSYASQLDNGIPILPYYHGKTDFQLKALEIYLQKMVFLNDVRTLNRQTFQLHRYKSYYNQGQRLVEELYMNEQNNL